MVADLRARAVTPLRELAARFFAGGGAGLGLAAAIVLGLSAWARCSELGPPAQVAPWIRAFDAGTRRDR